MAANSRYTIAVHSLLLLEGPEGGFTSSEWIAASVNTNPAFIRKVLARLREDELVEGGSGRTGGYRLMRAPGEVTLWDVYQTFRGEEGPFALHASKPNPSCPIGGRIQKHLRAVYKEADESMRRVLGKTTLASLKARIRNG